MKKYCLLLLCWIVLAGCAQKGTPPEAEFADASQITAKWKETVFTVTVTDTGCKFSFDAPETLRALTLVYDGKKMTADCNGLVTEVPTLFAKGILPFYRGVLACKSHTWQNAEEGIRRITLDGETFLLYYDPAGECITRLEVKGAEGTAEYEILSCIKSE